jgi:L-asparagine transporter-like permease
MLSPVARKFRKTSLTVLCSYFLLFLSADYAAQRVHPAGVLLWVLSALPILPIFVIILLFGKYLREERDEYKRDMAVRCLLWGTGGALLTNFFAGFLTIFGWKGQMFPFSEFFVFTALVIAAKLTYRVANRVPEDADLLVKKEGAR